MNDKRMPEQSGIFCFYHETIILGHPTLLDKLEYTIT